MPRKPKPLVPLEEAPRLFDFPEEPHLVEVVKQYRHTGTTALKDEPRVAMAVELLTKGIGIERICERVRAKFGTGFSPHTVREFRLMLSEGKLAGIKEQISSELKELALDVAQSLREDLYAGRLDPHDKSVLLGISVQQIPALDGTPSMVIEHRHVPVLTVDALNASLLAAIQAAPEIASGEPRVIAEAIDVVSTLGPYAGPCAGGESAPPAAAGDQGAPMVPVPRAAEATRPQGGGGGSKIPPGPAEADESSPGNFGAKESLPPATEANASTQSPLKDSHG